MKLHFNDYQINENQKSIKMDIIVSKMLFTRKNSELLEYRQGSISILGIVNIVFWTENIISGVYTNILAKNIFQNAAQIGLYYLIFNLTVWTTCNQKNWKFSYEKSYKGFKLSILIT